MGTQISAYKTASQARIPQNQSTGWSIVGFDNTTVNAGLPVLRLSAGLGYAQWQFRGAKNAAGKAEEFTLHGLIVAAGAGFDFRALPISVSGPGPVSLPCTSVGEIIKGGGAPARMRKEDFQGFACYVSSGVSVKVHSAETGWLAFLNNPLTVQPKDYGSKTVKAFCAIAGAGWAWGSLASAGLSTFLLRLVLDPKDLMPVANYRDPTNGRWIKPRM